MAVKPIMKGITRLGISIYISVIILIALNLLTGPGGLKDYRQLQKYRTTIEQNIAALQGINSELLSDSGKLIHQADEIKIQARELGWVEANEGIIVVRGYDQNKPGYSMGKLLSREIEKRRGGYSIKLLALLGGILFYVFSGFYKSIMLQR